MDGHTNSKKMHTEQTLHHGWHTVIAQNKAITKTRCPTAAD